MSPFYVSLLKLATTYIGAEKAASVLERQLKSGNFSPATFTQANLKAILSNILGSVPLYIADAAKKEDARAMITRMAG